MVPPVIRADEHYVELLGEQEPNASRGNGKAL
jgi:hypothetical protein